MSIFTPEVIVIFTLDVVFFCLLGIAAVIGFRILNSWDMAKTSELQYTLEKQTYLASTIVKFSCILNILLVFYFVFVLDKLALIIPGAMCAAGVVNATPFGPWLLGLKIFNLFLFGFWLVIHHYDMQHETLPYTRKKFALLLLMVAFFSITLVLEWLTFQALNPQKIVSCCGTIYAGQSAGLSWRTWPDIVHIIFFYGSFGISSFFFIFKRPYGYAGANLIFLIAALLSLVVVFSTYIYELPTHRCPFCLLQNDYSGIGYLLYVVLFTGVFSGVVTGGLKLLTKEKPMVWYYISFGLNLSYLIIVSLYPVMFYFKNGVWLKTY